MSVAPLLVLAVGNPSRGDDAAGPLFLERLALRCAPQIEAGAIELLTDFQLQVEHALDLVGRDRVLFVDATTDRTAPFTCRSVSARPGHAHTTHVLEPAAVLETYRQVEGAPPPAWVLAIRGEQFELGADPSPGTLSAIEAACTFFEATFARGTAHGSRLDVTGTVQGVGMRPWVARTARALGLTGRVRNRSSRVQVELFGEPSAVDAFVRAMETAPPPAARIERSACTEIPWEPCAAFEIVASEADDATGLPLPADLSTCDACLRDVDDPGSRHHAYAFTSCTDCGPRYAVTDLLPYDRAHTTLRGFPLCAACAADYADLDARRFHAETLACPRCGPRVWLADVHGAEIPSEDPIADAAGRLGAGEILAIRGLGAFHLACDARDRTALERLRARKGRDAKPFAVMVRDLAMAEELALVDDTARAALRAPDRPIVLVPARADLWDPRLSGPSQRVGLMLPYTPLHHRLLGLAARPLVMTSGNRSGEPVVLDNDEAIRVLGPLCEALLLHDRPIVHRAEDSVVSVDAGAVQVIRRARGRAPNAIRLPIRSPEPVLAVGGHLKNTVCIVLEDRAYVSPHLGDLETWESERAWVRELEAFERLLRVQPAVVAHDLHPGYVSTRYAAARPSRTRVPVQHHVAHVLATVAERGLEGPVLGLAFDGTGWGLDGTAWGGEFLLVDGPRWSRLATFRPIALAGGERAVVDVWRQALAWLHDAFGAEARALAAKIPGLCDVPVEAREGVSRMLEAGVQTVGARGVGRAFDAAASLVLGATRAQFEGHWAIALEEAAGIAPAAPFPWSLDTTHPEAPEIDLRPTVRALVAARLEGIATGVLAARFHATLVEAAASVAQDLLARTEARSIVLTGGAFQNRTLRRGLAARLGADRIVLPQVLPVNDGGLSLGQAFSAILALHSNGEA